MPKREWISFAFRVPRASKGKNILTTLSLKRKISLQLEVPKQKLENHISDVIRESWLKLFNLKFL